MRVLGLDPGLRRTGWGVIRVDGSHLSHVANGTLATDAQASVAERLVELHEGLLELIAEYTPSEAAVEETFVNVNPASTLKLGLARGVILLTPALTGLKIAEYAPNQVKKAVVGAGHAEKSQVQLMVRKLLPGCRIAGADAADALAVAICHAHYAETLGRWASVTVDIGHTT